MPDLPADLTAAVARLLEGRSRAAIAERAALLSQGYRAGESSKKAIGSEDDVLAYLLARMPATHAAIAACLREVALRAPGFVPRSLLDAGAGPGTASWAAAEIFPELVAIEMIDASARFRTVASQLAQASAHAALAQVRPAPGDVTRDDVLMKPSDLVIAGYLLAELDEQAAIRLATRLWNAASGILLLVEPGTPAGYRKIIACRKALLAQGARIVAPCPHASVCPLHEPDWCHFVERLPRSRDHMIAKAARVPFEDEKFSYLALAREHVVIAPPEARVLAPPRRNKAAIAMKLCVDGGVEMRTVARRDRAAFAAHRNVEWGEGI